jgi:hypothetical protein
MVKVAAARLPVPTSCLSRSVVLWALLRAQGVDATLRFGVRRAGEGIDAHAWVEYHDRPLNDADDVGRRFAVLTAPRRP